MVGGVADSGYGQFWYYVAMRWSAVLVSFLLAATKLVSGCAPPQSGSCFSGTFSSNVPNIMNQKCANDLRKDWCAVTYQPVLNEAHFGCLNAFPLTLGKTCGDGAFDINTQGCHAVDTPNGGQCYLCCCKGGGCNHPKIFMEEAQRNNIGNFANQGNQWTSQIAYGNSAVQNMLWLTIIVWVFQIIVVLD